MLKVQIINKGHQPLPAFATPQRASSYGAPTRSYRSVYGIAGWL